MLVLAGKVPTKQTLKINFMRNDAKLTEELEVALASLELVEANISLDRDTRTWVAEVWIVT